MAKAAEEDYKEVTSKAVRLFHEKVAEATRNDARAGLSSTGGMGAVVLIPRASALEPTFLSLFESESFYSRLRRIPIFPRITLDGNRKSVVALADAVAKHRPEITRLLVEAGQAVADVPEVLAQEGLSAPAATAALIVQQLARLPRPVSSIEAPALLGVLLSEGAASSMRR